MRLANNCIQNSTCDISNHMELKKKIDVSRTPKTRRALSRHFRCCPMHVSLLGVPYTFRASRLGPKSARIVNHTHNYILTQTVKASVCATRRGIYHTRSGLTRFYILSCLVLFRHLVDLSYTFQSPVGIRKNRSNLTMENDYVLSYTIKVVGDKCKKINFACLDSRNAL